MFDDGTGSGEVTARGVKYTPGRGEQAQAQLRPGGEVILSAGAVNSPHILQVRIDTVPVRACAAILG